VTVEVEGALFPRLNTLDGVGSVLLVKLNVKAAPPFTSVNGVANPGTLSAEMLRCCCANWVTAIE